MKKVLFLIFTVISNLIMGGLPSSWELSLDPAYMKAENNKIWKFKMHSSVIVNLQRSKPKEPIDDWSKVQGYTYFKQFEQRKKELLSLASITKWKVNKYFWKK